MMKMSISSLSQFVVRILINNIVHTVNVWILAGLCLTLNQNDFTVCKTDAYEVWDTCITIK